MQVDILGEGAFSSALVHLNPGEQFTSEAGALFRSSSNVDVDVTTRSKGKGGILGGLKRMLSSESFFLSTYTILDKEPGEVGLAPVLQGQMISVGITPEIPWMCTGGSWIGSSEGLLVDTRFQGLKGLFTGESLSFLHLSGEGTMLISGFGRLTEIEVDGALTVDTGHVVAFEESLTYKLSKAGGSWIHAWLGGEGIVMEFEGRGKLIVQSHNAKEFGSALGRRLPPREA
ncbi:MAG: hypothetical protein ACI82F_003218 [Planctomycetota bacterium]|jgi:uncharacterized protein (TIGR00266 family)